MGRTLLVYIRFRILSPSLLLLWEVHQHHQQPQQFEQERHFLLQTQQLWKQDVINQSVRYFMIAWCVCLSDFLKFWSTSQFDWQNNSKSNCSEIVFIKLFLKHKTLLLCFSSAGVFSSGQGRLFRFLVSWLTRSYMTRKLQWFGLSSVLRVPCLTMKHAISFTQSPVQK